MTPRSKTIFSLVPCSWMLLLLLTIAVIPEGLGTAETVSVTVNVFCSEDETAADSTSEGHGRNAFFRLFRCLGLLCPSLPSSPSPLGCCRKKRLEMPDFNSILGQLLQERVQSVSSSIYIWSETDVSETRRRRY